MEKHPTKMTAETAFYMFALALDRVPVEYYSYNNQHIDSEQVGERVFCYELYHQLRVLVPYYLSTYSIFRIDAEINKVLYKSDIYNNEAEEIYKEKAKSILEKKRAKEREKAEEKKRQKKTSSAKSTNDTRIIPDLVIHEGQETCEGQYLICEVKVCHPDKKCISDGALLWDLLKLYRYLLNPFTFGKAVFLCINCDFAKLKEKIIDLFKLTGGQEEQYLKKIIIMGGQYGDLYSKTLYDILDEFANKQEYPNPSSN